MNSWFSKANDKLLPLAELRTSTETLFFVRVLLFAACVPLLLRLRLTTLQLLLEPKFEPPPASDDDIVKIIHCVENAIRVGKPLVRPGCLTRGVTNYYFLKRAGADVTLCFGIGRVGEEFAGHCWLTAQGEPIFEATDPRIRFARTYCIPHPDSGAVTP